MKGENTMDGASSSTPGADGWGQSNDIRSSQNRPESSRRRPLERRQSDEHTYRTLVDRLGLSERLVGQIDTLGISVRKRIEAANRTSAMNQLEAILQWRRGFPVGNQPMIL